MCALIKDIINYRTNPYKMAEAAAAADDAVIVTCTIVMRRTPRDLGRYTVGVGARVPSCGCAYGCVRRTCCVLIRIACAEYRGGGHCWVAAAIVNNWVARYNRYGYPIP